MASTNVAQRQDLVNSIDADAILDYLSCHGVLDREILDNLDNTRTVTERNSVVLRQVDQRGSTGVALLINALRQSGQFRLANSLDTEQKIRPPSGNNYFGNARHKGELTIKIGVEALKIRESNQVLKITKSNQALKTTDSNQALKTTDSNQALKTTDSNQALKTTDSNQALKTTDSNQALKTTDSNQALKITESNQTLKTTDSNQALKIAESNQALKITESNQPLKTTEPNQNSKSTHFDTHVDTPLLETSREQHTRSTACDTDSVLVEQLPAEEDEVDFVKPKPCWCFCLSFKGRVKTSLKNTTKQRQSDTVRLGDVHLSVPLKSGPNKPHEEANTKNSNKKSRRKKSKEKSKKTKDGRTKSSSKQKSKKDQNKVKDMDNSRLPNADDERSRSLKNETKFSETGLMNESSDRTANNQSKFPSQIAVRSSTETTTFRPAEVRIDNQDVREHAVFFQAVNPKLAVSERSPVLQHESSSEASLSRHTSVFQNIKDNEQHSSITVKYNSKSEMVKLQNDQTDMASPMKQSGNTNLVKASPMKQSGNTNLEKASPMKQSGKSDLVKEQWHSHGPLYQKKASQVCEEIAHELQTKITKYFEQDQGILLLDVVSNGTAVHVVTICTLLTQVRCIQQDVQNGTLLKKLQQMFSEVDFSVLDIHGMKFKITLDSREINFVREELS